MEELKDIETIDRYLNGSLSDLEKKSLEQRLLTDVSFHQLFDDVQEAILSIHVTQEVKIKAIIKEEQDKILKTGATTAPSAYSKRYILRGWLAAAASIGIIIMVAYWLTLDDPFTFTKKPNNWVKGLRDQQTFLQEKQRIYNQYGAIEGEKLLKGLSEYENDNFAQAANILLSIDLQNDTLTLYQANALIKANNATQAISILEKISNNSPTAMERDWYLAIAYWRAGNLAKAKSLLTDIANNTNHGWQQLAQKQLQQKPFK